LLEIQIPVLSISVPIYLMVFKSSNKQYQESIPRKQLSANLQAVFHNEHSPTVYYDFALSIFVVTYKHALSTQTGIRFYQMAKPGLPDGIWDQFDQK
jgi:hypothetical protein